MADRVLSVRLRMEVEQARRDSKQLADSLRKIGNDATGAGKSSSAALAGIQTAARAAGTAASAVGTVTAASMAAATVAVVKGGVAYNTLEQTSRAALTTLTGSASAATQQMEQLREFGKTSPFPRQVWIAAQQQLLAFGMSAEKIIPTFQAIQDAVAAAGGGGQQISEVVDVLAKVQSTGKVSADTLNELGYRGIDAAALIGEAMGKTAGEVRADITAQAISGTQFIDMLTTAMESRFGGAAANVKETWAGATDRIKGAIRDIGGLLASPLVDPAGGGAAVEWANGIADALRALESRLEPVIAALRERAGPAIDAMSAKFEALANWIRTADFGAIGAKIQAILPAIVGVTAGFATMGAKSLPIIGNLVGGLKPLPVALFAAAMASPELRQALLDLLQAAMPLIAAVGDAAKILAAALGPALQVVAALLQPVIAVVQVLGTILGSLPGPIQAVVGAFVAWKALGIGSWLMENVGALTRFGESMKVQQSLAAMSGQQIGTMGAAYSAAATKVSGAAMGIRGAISSAAGLLTGPWGAAITFGVSALAMFASGASDAQTATEEFNIEIERSTGALTGASIESIYRWAAGADTLTNNGAHLSDVLKDFGLTAADLTGYLTGNAEATEKVNKALASHDSAAERAAFQQFLDITKGKIQDQIQVQQDAANAADRYGTATDGAAGSSADAAAAADGLTGSLYGVGSAADDIATRAQQLQSALSGIFDAQFGLQQAADGFQSKLHSLSNAFASNDKATTKSAASGEKYADSLKRQQKIIKDTRKQLEDLAEAQRKAEEEAAEAARAARQRALDELFGKQFDVQSTMDAFQAALAQAGKDIAEGRGKAGGLSLSGFSEGALANRERLRGLVQAAQAAIQAERNQGAGADRINQLTGDLSSQLEAQAAGWGLNLDEVRQYTAAIRSFGSLALQPVTVDLSAVNKQFADQRAEIQENSAEQMENARQSARSASAAQGAASATKVHTAALKGNSESAIENREYMRASVHEAQNELTQMHLNGASKEEVTRRGQELSAQLMAESLQLGFTQSDVEEYTGAIIASAAEIARYPTLTARADTAAAQARIADFVRGVNEQLAKIERNLKIGVYTGSEYINSQAGGKIPLFNADGGFITGPGGPRDDKILSWLSNGEYVVNARDTARTRPMLEAINAGEDPLPRFATGGHVDPIDLEYYGLPSTGLQEMYDAAMRELGPLVAAVSGPLGWAASQMGKPYIWGGVGPAGYDCSGFQSAITNVIQHRSPHSRRFATGSFPTGDFDRGPGNYMIGFFRGNPGHMAGTLLGANVESRGGEGVVVGKRARGANDRLFGGNVWHLKGFRDGGMVGGDGPFDLLSPLGMYFGDDKKVKGSYAVGTDYVPMDGLYQLHRGEAVVPAAQNSQAAPIELRLLSDGTKFGDLVVDSFNKAQSNGRLRVVVK